MFYLNCCRQEPLSSVKTITMLSLLHNAVVAKPNYRLFVIHKFPNLRILDFKRVKDKVEFKPSLI